ncbi:Curculin domain protein (mannose-binding) lectin [Segniliparus rotundus DSM 44985]|uniref:Curculin domain protein (Mannose-binding) lectin n=1 Tax=Segniliparus rotundus (strain ATCC BAA-972 / CDC 1076 / CIP 108378 / DSM 44985 / JCM 13578) TaxID=640132 RepID=D6ZD84_SEGRD|nr:LysM peptidoglycan-binding domain-containing protein [Segniliparus rotundus]ADG97148.1 Curculin domain protein (mannose-binding) lectin [Segniliparus rotundus DSM 44985]
MANLQAGQSLTKGQVLSSDNGAYTLTLQDDGNLVLSEGSNAVWSSKTQGQGVIRLDVQTDGNVVLYTGDHDPKWATKTKGDVHLALQDDRNLVVYGADGSALWNSGTATDAPPPAAPSADEEPAAPEPQTYVVAGGDTLSAIAQKFYGDANLYPKIAEANGIANPDLINVGQELTIPAL